MALICCSYLSITFVGILQKQLHLQKVHFIIQPGNELRRNSESTRSTIEIF